MTVIEEQNLIHQKRSKSSHQNQIEALTKTITQQINTLKGEMADMTAKTAQIHSQLASIQASSPSPSYVDVARMPPGSRPSNVRTVTSIGSMRRQRVSFSAVELEELFYNL
jgi:hypothetical protein